MNAIFYNTKRKSELDPAVATFYDDCLAQATIGIIKVGKNSTSTKHVFTDIGADEIGIATRLLFLNSSLASVEKYPVFIFAKKGFESTEVFEGLPYRTYEATNEVTGETTTIVRSFLDWHLEGNTSIIRESADYILIRTEVESKELTDTELKVLNDLAITEGDVSTTTFKLWGVKELKELENTFFPSLEEI
jgi:hypothetical protein